VLGFLPGALRGLAVAALLVLLVSALPPEIEQQDSLRGSMLARPILDFGLDVLDAGLAWVGIDLRTLGEPSSALLPGSAYSR
jgi:hypothetical protein